MLTIWGEGLSAAQMCHVVGCTYRQLDYWIRTGAITPALDANGSGSRRLFSRDQVKVVLAVTLLRQAGFGVQCEGGNHGIDREGARYLASIEGPWAGKVIGVSENGPLKVSLDLGWIESEAERLIAEFGRDRVRVSGNGRIEIRPKRRELAAAVEARAIDRAASGDVLVRRRHSSEWAGAR